MRVLILFLPDLPPTQNLTSISASPNAVRPPKITVQPLISAIHCKLLNILANPMVKSFMFASHAPSRSNRRLLQPLHSNPCHPACLERSRRECQEGSAFPYLPALASCPLYALRVSAFSHHASGSLFSLFRNNRKKLNPFLSHSSALFKKECSPNPFSINTLRTLLQNTRGVRPKSIPYSALSRSFAPNSFTIRTYAKHTRNPFRMRTSKTQHLKSFRIRTYEKKGEGASCQTDFSCLSPNLHRSILRTAP